MEFIKDHIIELFALVISVIALFISVINFWLNRARVVTFVNYFNEMTGSTPSEEEIRHGMVDYQEIIEFIIVNKGRRPIKIKSFSGVSKSGNIFRIKDVNEKLNEFEDFSYSDIEEDFNQYEVVEVFFEDTLGRRYRCENLKNT